MPYIVNYNDGERDHKVGEYTDFTAAYKAAHAKFPEMTSATDGNRWHVMMLAYAKKLMEEATEGQNPLKIAYQEATPNPEDDVFSVYICRQ